MPVRKKIIQITLEPELLARLDEEVKLNGQNRSALVRAALGEHLRKLLRQRWVREEIEAYRRKPIRKGEFPPPDDTGWNFGDRW